MEQKPNEAGHRERHGVGANPTDDPPKKLPRCFSKKDLCIHFGYYCERSGRPDYRKLYMLIFPPRIIKFTGIPLTTFKERRIFRYDECRRIIEVLQMQEEWQG